MGAGMDAGAVASEFSRGVPARGRANPMPPSTSAGRVLLLLAAGATARPSRGAPWSAMNGTGSRGVPLRRISKWRWFPSAVPVAPSVPRTCPTATGALGRMAGLMRARCAYREVMPPPWSMSTALPYPPRNPAAVTVPAAAATTGPGAGREARSVPECSFQTCLVGWNRIPNGDVRV